MDKEEGYMKYSNYMFKFDEKLNNLQKKNTSVKLI